MKNISGISLEVAGSRDKFSDGDGSALVGAAGLELDVLAARARIMVTVTARLELFTVELATV